MKTPSPTEFRVVWKRVGLKPKFKRYATRPPAERYMRLFGPEPWTVYAGNHPNGQPVGGNDLVCCSGYECGCGGVTHRQQTEAQRKEMPALEWVRLESRPVGRWAAVA